MNEDRNIYVCPDCKEPLECRPGRREGTDVISGRMICECGLEYPIEDGIPDLGFPIELEHEQKEVLDYYERVVDTYDDVANLSFCIQYVDETKARKGFLSHLDLTPSHRVLDLGCGTGRDSELIAGELDETGRLYLQDLNRSMLLRCREKLRDVSVPVEHSVGNACHIAFPDNYFDAVMSFGCLGVFGDIRRSLREIVRVSKTGAKVVVGDESLAPWLHETEYGKILLNNNPLFENPIPLEQLPAEARDVALRWVVGGVYYLIDFVVGEGEPKADFDCEILGKRGGTLRMRYYGRLEGVTPEAHELAHRAREKSGKSMHRWLDDVVLEAARRQLDVSSETEDEE